MSEKPLHVRVAEALGWRDARCIGNRQSWDARLPPPTDRPRFGDDMPQRIPRYDTDWSATGPLIERLGINIVFAPTVRVWVADTFHHVEMGGMVGPAPLIAVCNLILRLAAEGKLPNGET